MGLLDSLLGLFGGDRGERDHGDGDRHRGPGGDGGGVRRREREGGHGDHWDALVDLEDEAAFQRGIVETIETGSPVEGEPLDGHGVTGYLAGDDGCRSCAVAVEGQVATAYPALSGVEHDVTVEEVLEWHTGLEAQVEGTLGPASLALFDTRYFARRDYEPGRTYPFSVAALAYDLFPAEDETLEGPNGEKLSTGEMAGYFPFERGDVDDVVFQTTVKDVETFAFDGRPGYRLVVPLFRTEEEDGSFTDVDVALYAGERVLDDYVPAAGDAVQGVAWLQGHRV